MFFKKMEEKVSDTILEQSKKIVIARKEYEVAPPSFATLILFSKYVKKFPSEALTTDRPIASLLQVAEDTSHIAEALAVIVLGAKEFHKEEATKLKFRFFGLFSKIEKRTKGQILAEKIKYEPIAEVLKIFYFLIESLNLKDFFQLTTSLIEMNAVKPTKKEVEN